MWMAGEDEAVKEGANEALGFTLLCPACHSIVIRSYERIPLG